jgi:hypothetical protein
MSRVQAGSERRVGAALHRLGYSRLCIRRGLAWGNLGTRDEDTLVSRNSAAPRNAFVQR